MDSPNGQSQFATLRQLVARAHTKINERDLDDLGDIFDPEVVLDLSRLTFNPDVYHGFAGLREWVEGFDQTWEKLHHELVSVVAVDGRVVAHTRLFGRGLRGGVPVEMDMFGVFLFRDERIAHLIGAFRDFPSAFEISLRPLAPTEQLQESR